MTPVHLLREMAATFARATAAVEAGALRETPADRTRTIEATIEAADRLAELGAALMRQEEGR